MGSGTSHRSDSALESHTEGILYRKVSAFESSEESSADDDHSQWHPIKCILDGQTLTYFELDDSLRCEQSIPIDEDFYFAFEDHRKLELTLRLYSKETHTQTKWMLRAADMASFSVWSVVLKRAKRPKWEESSACQGCLRPFSFMARPRHCRNCGQVLCPKCCSQLGNLPHLGYFEMQRLCNRCAELPLVKKANEDQSGQRQRKAWLLCDQS